MRQPTLSIQDDAPAGGVEDAGGSVLPEPDAGTTVSRFPEEADFVLEEDCEEWNTLEFFRTATVEAVREHLAHSADPNARDEHGWAPLHLAAAVDADRAIPAALLEAGANPRMRGRDRRTPLHFAAAYTGAAVVRLLVEAGADPNARNRRGSTPLHLAAFRKCGRSLGTVTELLGAHADPNARSVGGWRPLHLAALNGTPAVVDALLDAGADPTARAGWTTVRARVTPRDLAQENASFRGTDACRRLAARRPWPPWLRGLGLVGFRALTGFFLDGAGAGISRERHS